MAAGLEGALKAQGLYSQSHLSPGVKLEGLLSLFAQDWAGVGRVSEPGTRMVGHPDIESTSKVTAGSDLRGPGGPPLLSSSSPRQVSPGGCSSHSVTCGALVVSCPVRNVQ